MALDPKDMSPAAILDLFIMDCIMPSTVNKERAQDIYDVFVAYCHQMDIGVPCEIKYFGKIMKKRFQRRLIQGRSYFFLEWKPGLFDAND